jgi:5-methyltetrahydrofolate corrinoid/iron sulfur protein methyltransferase
LIYEGLTAAIADAHEISPTVKTIDVLLGKTLYAHSYMEM